MLLAVHGGLEGLPALVREARRDVRHEGEGDRAATTDCRPPPHDVDSKTKKDKRATKQKKGKDKKSKTKKRASTVAENLSSSHSRPKFIDDMLSSLQFALQVGRHDLLAEPCTLTF